MVRTLTNVWVWGSFFRVVLRIVTLVSLYLLYDIWVRSYDTKSLTLGFAWQTSEVRVRSFEFWYICVFTCTGFGLTWWVGRSAGRLEIWVAVWVDCALWVGGCGRVGRCWLIRHAHNLPFCYLGIKSVVLFSLRFQQRLLSILCFCTKRCKSQN